MHHLLVLNILLECVLVIVLVRAHRLILVGHLTNLLKLWVLNWKLRLFLLLHKAWIHILLRLLVLNSLKLLLNIFLVYRLFVLLQLVQVAVNFLQGDIVRFELGY